MESHLLPWLCFLLPLLHVYAVPSNSYSSRLETAGPVWNSCGDLIREANLAGGVVYAIDVYNCWATVPFNSAVATRLITYWNDTLQLHSTIGWLKAPPQGYQKPAVDLLAGLQQVQDKIDTGQYNTQYDFETDLRRLVYSASDAHLSLEGGLLSAFKFGNPYGLTTLSLDGVQIPKVYTTFDLYLNQSQQSLPTWQPSAIAQINGRDVIEYLSEFAALNSLGTLEPHADWNTLMDSPVLDITLQFANFQGYTTFYPGDEFTFSFENGSEVTDRWLAIYNDPGDTGPLETGGDYYNFFVLGFYPASYNGPNTTETPFEPPVTTSLADLSIAYPENPDVFQANLTRTGFTIGYFYPESSLAVLSIPTFVMPGESIQSFSDTIQQFVDQAKARGLQRVVVDLQENPGGDVLLAYNTFKQFFPSLTPYGGSNRRAIPLANTLGGAISGYCATVSEGNPDFETCTAIEWDALVVLDATTNQEFTSWQQLYGPIFDGVDYESRVQRLNIQNSVYDRANLQGFGPPEPLLRTGGQDPWAASDIVILSDALCASACSLFLNFMRFDAGVRNVVVGGRPSEGPMQTPSYARGARSYSVFELDEDVDNALAVDPSVVVPNRRDNSFFIEDAGVNLRNQIGPDSLIPYQMEYQAADCRIFLTPNTFNNFSNLWHYAASAIWTDPGRCVQGSTGYGPATSGASSSAAPAPSVPAGVAYDPNGIVSGNNNTAINQPLLDHSDIPQPDAVLPLPRLRMPPFRGTSAQQFTENKTPPEASPQFREPKRVQNQQQSCRFFSAERASPQCVRKRALSPVKSLSKSRDLDVSRWKTRRTTTRAHGPFRWSMEHKQE